MNPVELPPGQRERNDFPRFGTQATVLLCAPGGPVTAKDVGDLQGGASHGGRTTTVAASPAG
jgi:hypothetical protein